MGLAWKTRPIVSRENIIMALHDDDDRDATLATVQEWTGLTPRNRIAYLHSLTPLGQYRLARRFGAEVGWDADSVMRSWMEFGYFTAPQRLVALAAGDEITRNPELEPLAREIADARQVSWATAFAEARRRLAGLGRYARAWDAEVAAARSETPPTA
jgi:hypothetical protein